MPRQKSFKRCLDDLHQALKNMTFVVSGTLLSRTKTCGRPNCRCAVDENARHGPYYEWNRRQNGRLVHKTISDEQAKVVAHALADYKKFLKLISKWEALSAEKILEKNNDGKMT